MIPEPEESTVNRQHDLKTKPEWTDNKPRQEPEWRLKLTFPFCEQNITCKLWFSPNMSSRELLPCPTNQLVLEGSLVVTLWGWKGFNAHDRQALRQTHLSHPTHTSSGRTVCGGPSRSLAEPSPLWLPLSMCPTNPEIDLYDARLKLMILGFSLKIK